MSNAERLKIATVSLAVALSLAMTAVVSEVTAGNGPKSPKISFEAVRYEDGIGCGLYVEFFKDGKLAENEKGETGGFVLGSSPAHSTAECLERCEGGLSRSFIRLLKGAARADEATGWCFKGRDVIGGPYANLPR